MKIFNNECNIGEVSFSSPFFLAPMAGFTDHTYRKICESYGASLVYSEMVSAKGLVYGSDRSRELLDITGEEVPVFFQLFGSEPEIMREAVTIIENEGYGNAGYDINMGCPVPKVVKNGEGSALLRSPEVIYQIIKEMKKATDKPITAKIRIGIAGADQDAHLQAARAIEEAGAAAVAVHGRTREQYYSGTVNYEAIAEVKKAVAIPVIGSGDIFDYDGAVKMAEETGVDYAMIGRGSLGNPWIFRELTECWNGAEEVTPISNEERLHQIMEHYRMLEADKGEYTAVRQIRAFTAKYLKGIPGGAAIRGTINTVRSGEEFYQIIEEALRR